MKANLFNISMYILSTSLLTIAPLSKAFSNEKRIITQTVAVPTCYEKSNTAVVNALSKAEKQAAYICGGAITHPVWLLKVDVRIVPAHQQNPCGGVMVKAEYLCD